MKFHCDGADFDTDHLITVPTKNRAMPFIYLSRDGKQVFVQTMDRTQGVVIRRITEEEIDRLSRAYPLEDVLRALRPQQQPQQASTNPSPSTQPPNPA